MPRNALVLLVILTGISFAQETNFSSGPQYLVTTSSQLFLRPISTPSLSLGQTTPTAEAAVAQEAPVPSGITNKTFLSNIYWGDHPLSDIEARRVTTPTVSLSEISMSSVSTFETAPTPEELPGLPPQLGEASSVIEISSAVLPANLPASIFETGVTGIADAQSLLGRGYGVSLGDLAAYWKAHKRSGIRVFTNRDVQHTQGN